MNEPTIYDIGASEYLPQPDFSAWQSERGGWTARQSFICRESALSDDAFRNKFIPGASPTDLDPDLDIYWEGLGLARVNWRNMPGGLATIDVHYEGFAASGNAGPDKTAPQYVLRGELMERSIMEHPKVTAITDLDDIALLRDMVENPGSFHYDETDGVMAADPFGGPGDWYKILPQPTGATLTYAKKILAGFTHFRAPTFTWSKRWQDKNGLTAAEVADLGKVDVPDGSQVEASGTRDWMLTSAYQTQTGNKYDNHLEWTMSPDGGWDSDLYDYA